MEYFDDLTYKNEDFGTKQFEAAEYSNCMFFNCNFQKSKLDDCVFADCYFKGCDFSLAVMIHTGIKSVQFEDCKLMGLDFSKCSDFLFAADFKNCLLDFSSFLKKKMKKTRFEICSLKSAVFEEADLAEALFTDCDLLNAVFINTNLEKADLHTSFNYSIDPDLNIIKNAIFSMHGLTGLLEKYHIKVVG